MEDKTFELLEKMYSEFIDFRKETNERFDRMETIINTLQIELNNHKGNLSNEPSLEKNISQISESVWYKISEKISKQLSDTSYKTWIAPLKVCINMDTDTCNIVCPSGFHISILEDRYSQIIENSVIAAVGRKLNINYI